MKNKQSVPDLDEGRPFDWGTTSNDYARHRPGPPIGLYERLKALGVGLPQQKILDLATGTGVVARQFARQAAIVTGLDIAPEQIEQARQLALVDKVEAEFLTGDAHRLPFPDHSFDVVTASQCWWYFDVEKILPEIKRVLNHDGLLVVTHFNYLPRQDAVAAASEKLILRFNPRWTGANWPVDVLPCPAWAHGKLRVRAMFFYDEDIPMTRESWRGRMRACRGIGASLTAAEVEAFDRAHQELLETITPESFTVRHRIDAHLFDFNTPSLE